MNITWKESIKIPLLVVGVIIFLYFFKFPQSCYGAPNF